METAINALLGVTLLIVLVWVVAFGASTAVLAVGRGGRAWWGFTLGAILGPLAWLVVLWLTRRRGEDGLAARATTGVRGIVTWFDRDDPEGGPSEDDVPLI